MKRRINLALMALLVIGSFTTQAQETLPAESVKVLPIPMSPSFNPASGDLGVVVNVSGLISNLNATPRTDLLGNSSFLFRYTHSPRVTYRLGLAPNISRTQVLSTDSVGKDLVEFDSTASRSQFSLRPGVEFHLSGTKRLDPYVALDAELGLIGRLSIGSVSNITDTTGTSRVVRTITEDGGYSLGGKLSVGANYFIAQNLFIGMEYGLGIRGLITGGDRQEVVQIEPVSGTNTTLRDLSSVRNNDLLFGVDPTVQITLGYFFGLK